MGQYRKKPVVIEARQVSSTDYDEACVVLGWCGGTTALLDDESDALFHISTLEGDMAVASGDWVIKGVRGEFYPCKPDIFDATYENVDITS